MVTPSGPDPLASYAKAPCTVVVTLEGRPHIRVHVQIPELMVGETLTDAARRGVAQYLADLYPASTFRPQTFDIAREVG